MNKNSMHKSVIFVHSFFFFKFQPRIAEEVFNVRIEQVYISTLKVLRKRSHCRKFNKLRQYISGSLESRQLPIFVETVFFYLLHSSPHSLSSVCDYYSQFIPIPAMLNDISVIHPSLMVSIGSAQIVAYSERNDLYRSTCIVIYISKVQYFELCR